MFSFEVNPTHTDHLTPPTVAAPSKIIRPAGDRIKTDARDAVLLARLLKMDEGLDGAGPGTLAAFDAGYDAVNSILARRDRLDRDIAQEEAHRRDHRDRP